jgi:small subunit ribosomal protein S2
MAEDETKENQIENDVETNPEEVPEETHEAAPEIIEEELVTEDSSEPVPEKPIPQEPVPEPSSESIPESSPVDNLLLPRDTMLSAGIHIGTRMKTKDMGPFIYRVRPDGLFVLDVQKTDERIRVAAKFLARFDPEKVAVAASRLYAHEPVRQFCKLTGAKSVIGRFVPGLLSNPLYPSRIDPEIIVVSDPRADGQAVKEASKVGIPIIALCSTDNEFSGVDLIIPTNNKGRRALAVIFWLLARQILRERGELPLDKDPAVPIEDFEAKLSRDEEDT